MLSIEEALRRVIEEDGRGLEGALVFTIDDGYADTASVAAPLFASFDIPVTTFVVTGFLDDALWMWWDQVEYLVDTADPGRRTVEIGGRTVQILLDEQSSRRRANRTIVRELKGLAELDMREGIQGLSEALGVDLPRSAPDGYRPMSWDEVRAAERAGMRFGPHTISHPILARSENAAEEIRTSWERISAECARPVPVFCYPNGRREDFGEREMSAVAALGMLGAVSAIEGYLDSGVHRTDRFRIPRLPYPDDRARALQYASGLDRVLTRS